MRIFRFFHWLAFLPTGLRRAWCEVRGGHDNYVNGCWHAGDRATHIALFCGRCEKTTRWYPVPMRDKPMQRTGKPGLIDAEARPNIESLGPYAIRAEWLDWDVRTMDGPPPWFGKVKIDYASKCRRRWDSGPTPCLCCLGECVG